MLEHNEQRCEQQFSKAKQDLSCGRARTYTLGMRFNLKPNNRNAVFSSSSSSCFLSFFLFFLILTNTSGSTFTSYVVLLCELMSQELYLLFNQCPSEGKAFVSLARCGLARACLLSVPK